MADSRINILSRLKEAEKGSPVETSKYRESMLKELGKVSPKNPDECLEAFRKELEAADGEVIRVKNIHDAAEKIADLADVQIISTMEIECESISDELSNKFRKDTIKLSEIPNGERKEIIAGIPAALVKASYAIADVGSMVFLYDETKTTYPHFLAETVFVILSRDKIVANQFQLLELIPEEKTRNMVFVTGPSRTADIEKVLILGAHGPKRVVVFIID